MTTKFECFPKILWTSSGQPVEQDCACAVEGQVWSSASLDEPLEGDPTSSSSSQESERLESAKTHHESDCACAEPPWSPLSSMLPENTSWRIAPALYRAPLPGAHELVFNPSGPVGPVVLNEPAGALLDAYRRPNALTDDIAHQLAALQLLMPIRGSKPEIRNPKSILTAWLHVTNACNLRCAYCYLDKTGEAMTEDVGRAAVDAIIRSAQANGFRAIKLKYAGGEPSLNFDLVQAIHSYALQKAAQAGLGLREVVLSNGVALTQAMLDWLKGENMRLMISLDGIGQAHDAQRTFINGRSSFDLVARNVDRALGAGLTPHLSITVTARNADKLADIVAFAIERDLLFNLNFVRDNGCVKTTGNTTADHDHLINGMKAAFAVIESNLPRRRLIDGLVDRSAFDAPHEHPCGAGRNYLVIDQRGRVSRCQMEIERAVTDVLADDPLTMVRARVQGFNNVAVDEKQGCRDCDWRYWCAGGCPLLAYRATGRSDIKSSYCDVYKSLYPDVLRLEGLRLLKWSKSI